MFVAADDYTGNGAAVMLRAVLEYWVQTLGWTVDVLFGMNEEVPEELADIGVTMFNTITPNAYNFALVNTLISVSHLRQLASHVPTVLWVHEGETLLWQWNLAVAEWRAIFELPRKVIFQTPWQPDVVFRSFLAPDLYDKVSCIANGLPRMPSELTPRRRSKGKKRVVFIGGVYARKRPQDLVDAIIAMQRDDVECVFIGSTANIKSIGSDTISLIESRPDLFTIAGELARHTTLEYIASADALCLPSGDESQPLAPLEAAFLGVPCLLTDLPPYAGTWKHGVNCLMHPIGHTALLRWNLSAAINDTAIRAPIINEARQLVAKFSLDRFLQQFTGEMLA